MTKYLLTSALPYINGVKHLGNLVGSVLPADVYARALRQSGHEVLFICGTDEHGTPAEIAAAEIGKPVSNYCDEMHALQKDIFLKFGISFDFFGRSSSPSNSELTQRIFKELDKNGYIQEKEIRQYYSFDDKRFLPDRYVEGTCPYCSYKKARGDQCDGCEALLDPENLIDAYSAISGSKNIELQNTRHLFLDLPKLEPRLKTWLLTRKDWPEIIKNTATGWINDGLQSRCITRDLKWGIQVPRTGYEDKVFYVWFDAPNAYISMTRDWAIAKSANKEREELTVNWEEWWLDCKNNNDKENNGIDDTYYVQFMGKDNVTFHAIFWPSVLLAANMGFKQVDYIKSFNWLTYDHGKFSTSQKRGVFMDDAIELYEADYWRYYLMANCPETSDSDFNFEHFASTINKDLADVLGNFCNRTVALIAKYHDSKIPLSLHEELIDKELVKKLESGIKILSQCLNDLHFRGAIGALRSLWVLGNEYISQKEPWKVIRTDENAAFITLVHCVHLMRLFAIISFPFIPFSSEQILKILHDQNHTKLASTPFIDGMNFHYFHRMHSIEANAKLFTKIESAEASGLSEKFAGNLRPRS